MTTLATLALLVAACGTDPTPPAGDDAADPEPAEQEAAPEPEDRPTREPDDEPASEAQADEATEPEDGPGPEPMDEGPPVPDVLDFTAPAVGGGRVVGAEYAGEAVALWFWAPW